MSTYHSCSPSPFRTSHAGQPKHLALSSLLGGDLKEMAGLLALRHATLALAPVVVKGISGFDNLMQALLAQWLASYSDKVRHDMLCMHANIC